MSTRLYLRHRSPLARSLVLGVALAAGLALAVVSDGEPPSPSDRPHHAALVIADASANTLLRVQGPADTKAAAPKAPDAPATPAPPNDARPKVDSEISISESGVVIRKGERGVVIGDRHMDEFDSFEQFVEQAPWLAVLVLGVTALVLLVPVLVIALVVWYKIRSNRMRNETMLKLAERGVVPPAEAILAVATSQPGAVLQSSPSTAPLYEQAKQIRKRAAWSDLRKGVIMGGIGLGLSFYSMLSDGEANALGLVLLFVGIGYIVLWYFEERQLPKPGQTGSSTTGGA